MTTRNKTLSGRVRGLVVQMAAAIFCVGSLLRLTIRDQVPPLSSVYSPFSAIYYGTPIVVLAVLATLLGIYLVRHQRNGWALTLFTIAVAWAITGCVTEFRSAPVNSSPKDQHILLWNMQNGRWGWHQSIAELDAIRPDIAGLVESYHLTLRDKDTEAISSDYVFSPDFHGLTIMTRGTIEQVDQGRLAKYGIYQTALVTVDGQSWRVVLVDLKSNPIISRRPSMLALQDLLKNFSDEPLLVMGDFNTPYDSQLFKTLPDDLQHAFRQHGNGYAATWPWPCPVLEVDHVWFNEQVVVSECRHTTKRYSDHRSVDVFCHAK